MSVLMFRSWGRLGKNIRMQDRKSNSQQKQKEYEGYCPLRYSVRLGKTLCRAGFLFAVMCGRTDFGELKGSFFPKKFLDISLHMY